MPATWHPCRLWKKEIKPIFTDKVVKMLKVSGRSENAFSVSR